MVAFFQLTRFYEIAQFSSSTGIINDDMKNGSRLKKEHKCLLTVKIILWIMLR